MTRINCLPPHTLLDQHLAAHLKEGLRPINNIKNGKTNISGCPADWKLGEGHEKFCRKHSLFTLRQWMSARIEYDKRYPKNQAFLFSPCLEGVPSSYIYDYTPTRTALRQNLARVVERWRKHRNNPKYNYTFYGKPIDNPKILKQYIAHVKTICNIH